MLTDLYVIPRISIGITEEAFRKSHPGFLASKAYLCVVFGIDRIESLCVLSFVVPLLYISLQDHFTIFLSPGLQTRN